MAYFSPVSGYLLPVEQCKSYRSGDATMVEVYLRELWPLGIAIITTIAFVWLIRR